MPFSRNECFRDDVPARDGSSRFFLCCPRPKVSAHIHYPKVGGLDTSLEHMVGYLHAATFSALG